MSPRPASPEAPAPAVPSTEGRPATLLRHADRKRLLMLLLGLLVGLDFLENGMFVFAASHIAGGVDAGPREFAQVQAIYAVASMLTIAMQQWLSRHFGYRRYLAGALALFIAGALAAAQAGSIAGLTLARAVQGLGAGALFTSSRILVQMLFAPADRPDATKRFMVGAFGAGALAPILAAAMVDGWGWQWVFLAILPLAGLALAGVLTLLPDGVGRGGEPVRWAAGPLLFFAAAIGCVQWALSEARYEVFAHPARLTLAVLGGAALAGAFLLHQWRHDEPLLRLRELRHSAFVTGLGLYFLYYFLTNFSGYLFPIFAERSLGLPLATTGWLNSFAGAVSVGMAWLYIRFGARMTKKKPLVVGGALGLALTAWLFAVLPPDAPAAALWVGVAVKGLFGVLMILPVAALTWRALDADHFAKGYQTKNVLRQMMVSLASAVGAVALQNGRVAQYGELASRINPGNPAATQWLDTAQRHFEQLGLTAAQAHQAAMAQLASLVSTQAVFAASQQLYRWVAVIAVAAAVVVAVQKRLR